jgi:hypothetical protein
MKQKLIGLRDQYEIPGIFLKSPYGAKRSWSNWAEIKILFYES